MKLSGYKEDYDYFTSRCSDVVRQLAFAGVAIVWIFRMGDGPAALLPNRLLAPLALLAASLLFDLLHYVAGSVTWGCFHRRAEKKLEDLRTDPEVSAPRWLNWPINTLFGLKILTVASAYIMIVGFLSSRWL